MRAVIRAAAAALLAAAMSSCSMFDYSGTVVHKFAFVYGVTTYSASGGVGNPNLSYPHKDAAEMASLLASEGYAVTSKWVDDLGKIYHDGIPTGNSIGSPRYSPSGVFSDSGYSPSSQAPTRDVIIGDIAGKAGLIGPNDVVLVYFSGHGTPDNAASPHRVFFDPYEGVAFFAGALPAGYYADTPKCVLDNDLSSTFAAIKTPRKVLILDTCNSGGFIGNQLEADWTSQSAVGSLAVVGPGTLAQAIANYASMQNSPTGLSPYGAQVLAAAGRDESSYEAGPPISHGIMTYYLLNGLGGAADLNRDGHITVLEAFAYAKAGVDQNWNQSPPAGNAPFEPHISGGPVDFVLF